MEPSSLSDLLSQALADTAKSTFELAKKGKLTINKRSEIPDLDDDAHDESRPYGSYPGSRYEGSVAIPKESNVFMMSTMLKCQNNTDINQSVKTNTNVASSGTRTDSFNSSTSVQNKTVSTGNKYLKNVPNSTSNIYNRTLTQPSKTSTSTSTHPVNILNQMHLKDTSKSINFVGGVMIDKLKLHANANNVSSTTKIGSILSSSSSSNSQTNMKSNHLNSQQIEQQRQQQKENKVNQLKDEVNSLLKRKSNHVDEAENEWFKKHNERMDKLIKKEHYLQIESQIESMTVKAFQCTHIDCIHSSITEKIKPTCYEKKHSVRPVSVIKRFFECGSCHRRNIGFTLGQSKVALPTYNCVCGVHNWISCGRKSVGGDYDPLNPSMVLTASEFTSRRDINSLKVMASELG